VTSQRLGPWTLGIDTISADSDMPTDNTGKIIAVRDALNVDFNREGWPDTKPGMVRLLTQAGFHSIYARNERAPIYAAYGANLARVTVTGPSSAAMTTIFTLPSLSPLDFDDLNGEVTFSSRDYLGVIGANDVVRPLCVPDAPGLRCVAATIGGMFAGRYGIAMAWVDATGKEGGLGPCAFLDVAEGGGVSVTMPPFPDGATFARLYRTHANGRILYRAADVPNGLSPYLLGRGKLGKRAAYQYLRAMKPGDMVRYWRGHLLTAIGNTMQISKALAYHLTDPRHGCFYFPREVAFIEGVEGGVYVGQVDDTVLFLGGTDYRTWSPKTTGGNEPFPRSSTKCNDDLFDSQFQLQGEMAVWLAGNGYVIGKPDGTLLEPQTKRVDITAAPSRTTVFGRRVLTIVNQ
jgi:hypothetical protein